MRRSIPSRRIAAAINETELSQQAGSQELAAEENVLAEIQGVGHSEVLVDGLDAVLPRIFGAPELDRATLDLDCTRVGDDSSGQRSDESRFPGSVVPDQGMYLSAAKIEVDAPQGADVPIALRDRLSLEHWLEGMHIGPHSYLPYVARRRAADGHEPLGDLFDFIQVGRCEGPYRPRLTKAVPARQSGRRRRPH